MSRSYVPPGFAWLNDVRMLGEMIRLRCYDEPHAGQVTQLMSRVISGSIYIDNPYERFVFLDQMYRQVVSDTVAIQYGPQLQLVLINQILPLYSVNEFVVNDEYSRFLIGRKCHLLRLYPHLGSPGELSFLTQELRRITPPSQTKQALKLMLDVYLRYRVIRRQLARK